MLRLFCVVVGRKGNPFSVEIAAEETVDDLKDMVKEKKESITYDADELELYLALKDGAWIGSKSSIVREGVVRDTVKELIQEDLELDPADTIGACFVGEQEELKPEIATRQIHVLVVVPEGARSVKESEWSAMELSTVDLPLKQDITELTEWSERNLYELPSISEFMKDLGGCTQGGKLYWRLEEKQIASIILTGWSGADLPHCTIKNKKCILMGSPGVGKSTMLCLLAFYVVFEQKKNVLIYRKVMSLDQDCCLVYLGYENNQVKYFTLPKCEVSQAREIYKALQLKQEVYLMLDGFVYKDIPEGLRTFKLLATSQQVDLKSQEREYAYCLLHPCWELKDLKCLGLKLKGWEEDDVSERFYYSGGSVREFLLDTVEDVRIGILAAIRSVDDPLVLMSNSANTRSGSTQVDRLRRTFVKDPNDQMSFITSDAWEQLIDSEYARIFNWAKAAGHASLAGSVFELYLHLLAADNRLKLYVSEYDLPEPRKSDCDRHLNVKELHLQHGRAICTGTATDYETDLTGWRDNDNFAYWFPNCYDFPNIDSIVKLKLDSGKKQVAYLQITIAKKHPFDERQLKTMNNIFKQEQADPPIYIVVCPDLASCKTIVLTPANAVPKAIKENIQVFAGYYKMDSDISADGPNNHISLRKVPSPRYQMRKRPRKISIDSM
ncbi:hypothetical protein AC1031_000026 [Aphanomyces cochlioides]|nr:hypothetical protein AC1031_000026 [Aphanomyces cochlioides]